MTSKTQTISIDIEIPEGYEYVGFRKPETDELYMQFNGNIHEFNGWGESKFPILKKIMPKIKVPYVELDIMSAQLLVQMLNTTQSQRDDRYGNFEGHTHTAGCSMKIWKAVGSKVHEQLCSTLEDYNILDEKFVTK